MVGKGLPDADLFGGRFVPRRRLAHHKQRDELCSRKRSAYNKDNGTVRGDGVAADHKAAAVNVGTTMPPRNCPTPANSTVREVRRLRSSARRASAGTMPQ